MITSWLMCGACWALGMFGRGEPETVRGTLQVEVTDVQEAGGMIWLGLYDGPDHFLDKEKAVLKGVVVERAGVYVIALEELPFGAYALAVFHDQNNNGLLDQNWLGIPKEPFAFSRPISSKWRLPRFEEVSFVFDREKQVVRTSLKRWRKH